MRFPASYLVAAALLPLLSPLRAAEHGQSTYVVPDGLVPGGAFIDRFLPMRPNAPLRADVWGADAVKPRDVANGVEDAQHSYWCTSVVQGPDGKYHNFVVRWPENTPKGHFEWPNSDLVRAVGDSPTGPFKIVQEIGKGHNVTAYQAKDGTWILYIINGCYRGPTLEGPWTKGKLSFDNRGRKGVDMTNATFARRADGSYLMVNRSGEIWISKDGNQEPYRRVSNRGVYPPVGRARFEDPVVWKDDVQYNLIVNDWFGRAAYYLRSRDGITWDWDQGLAYGPGVIRHPDGRVEDWFKIERPRVFQDSRGRATHMYFAVIDVPKDQDRPDDIHSSKALGVPLVAPRTVKIQKQDDRYLVALGADAGFDPAKDVDPSTLRFGAPAQVDFGRAASPLSTSVNNGWLIATFAAKDCGFVDTDGTAKLLGRDHKGGLVLGYSALPGEPEDYALLSPHAAVRAAPITDGRRRLAVEVENFGLAASPETEVVLAILESGGKPPVFTAPLPSLAPYAATTVDFSIPGDLAPAGATLKLELRIGARSGRHPLRVDVNALP